MYEIVMPQLSDSMESGKLIAWKVKEGQEVKSGDVIAEVESDKAIMEVQTFKDGRVAKLLVDEGSQAKVGEVIALIETSDTDKELTNSTIQTTQTTSQSESKHEHPAVAQEEDTQNKEKPTHPKEGEEPLLHPRHHEMPKGVRISPKARAKAAEYALDANEIAKRLSLDEIHAEDIQRYIYERYFTPKAKALLERYGIDPKVFVLDHKIDEAEVQSYITRHSLALPQPLSSMQKAIIANVSSAAKRPVFHLYEHIDTTLMQKHEEYTITAWLVRIFSIAMMRHRLFRTVIKDERLFEYRAASISVAVAREGALYMPVVHSAEQLSMQQIASKLESFKEKLAKGTFVPEELQGSTFGISNLGMLGVERFDAMINKNDSAIAAVGAATTDNKATLTLSVDHRVVNGYEAARFMQDVKALARDATIFLEDVHV